MAFPAQYSALGNNNHSTALENNNHSTATHSKYNLLLFFFLSHNLLRVRYKHGREAGVGVEGVEG